jgi:hypothetical protein
MKSIIPFMLLTCTALAQVPAAVELEQVNVLYIGVENPLHVVSDTVPDSCIVLRPSDGILKKVAPGKYTWFLQTDSTTVQLALTDSCSGTEIGVRAYRVKSIHPSQMRVQVHIGSGGHHNQSGLALLLNNINDLLGDVHCRVLSYEVAVYKAKTGEVLYVRNKGGRFGAAMEENTRGAVPGDKFRFFNIVCQCPGMSEPFHYAGDLHFSIK